MQINGQDNVVITSTRVWLVAVSSVFLLIWLLSPILSPFLFAAILAYIFNPIVSWLEKYRFSRTISTLLTMVLLGFVFFLLLLILIPLIQKESAQLMARLPAELDWFQAQVIPWIHNNLGVDISFDVTEIKVFVMDHLKVAGNFALQLLPSIRSGSAIVMSVLTHLLLVPVVFFFILRDWKVLLAHLEVLIPRRWHAESLKVLGEIDGVISEFLRGQLAAMLVMSVFYFFGLRFSGLELALPIGLISGLLGFIPFLGLVTGVTLAIVASVLQYQGLAAVVPILVVFGLGQVVEAFIVTPYLVGERIGLHPVVVIFSLMAFGQLLGFFGVMLALPMSAALLVGFRHLRQRYLASRYYHN